MKRPILACAPRTARARLRRAALAPAVALTLALGSPPALAADGGLEAVVVTGTRTPRAQVDLITDVSVIDARELEGSANASIGDALARTGGAQVVANGGPAAQTSVLLRGASLSQTLVLVDGFRLSSASLGQTTFEALPWLLADRVEVLRGPASGLYGTDAMGGVVQLFSPQAVFAPRAGARASAFTADAAVGGERTRRLRADGRTASDTFALRIRAAHETSDGFDATRPSYFAHQPDRDGYRRRGAVGQAQWLPTAGTRVGAVVLGSETDTQYDDGSHPDARTLARTSLVGITGSQRLGERTSLVLRVGESRDRSEAISSFPGLFTTVQRQAAATIVHAPARGVEASAGYERLEQNVTSSGYAPGTPGRRTTDSLLASIAATPGAHIVQASLRHDRNDQYGSRTSGSIAYGYRVAPGWRAGASAGTGFRAPSFNDLYFPFYGRAAIRPETSRSVEVGAYYAAGGLSGKAVVHRARYSDLIVYAPVCPDPDPQFVFGCADNVNRATVGGLSLAIAQRAGALRWYANVDLLHAQDDTLGRRLPRRPARQASAGVDLTRGAWRIAADVLAAGPRFDDASNAVRMGGYATLDARIEHRFAPELIGYASVVNLGDRDYETASGFRPRGRTLMVGVRYGTRW